MKRILRRRPSPGLVVAAIALFATFGGTAYALTITGANVRDGSLTGADIRNRSLTQADLKGRALKGTLMIKDSVGYNAVKEQVLDASKLKQVNSSKDSDRVGGVEVRKVEPFTIPVGGTRGVATIAPFTLTARCRAEGPNHVAEIVVQTNQNASAVDAEQSVPAFDIGAVAQLVATDAAAGTPAFAQAPGVAISPSGTTIHSDGLYAGASVLGAPNQCRFGGMLAIG